MSRKAFFFRVIAIFLGTGAIATTAIAQSANPSLSVRDAAKRRQDRMALPAQTQSTVMPQSGSERHLDPKLAWVRAAAQASGRQARQFQSQSTPSGPQLRALGPRLDRGTVRIEAIAESDGQDAALIRELSAAGAIDVELHGNTVSARMPLQSLDALGKVRSARFIRPAFGRISRVGVVTSQGDRAQQTDKVREKLNVNGKGTKVGLISDSFNALGGYASSVRQGDLPGPGNPYGYVTPVQIVKEGGPDGFDEGRAMAEIVHDLAPGAALAFYSPVSPDDHANAIRELAKAGATIVADDLGWINEPWYQETQMDRAMREVSLKHNVVNVTAAGNDAAKSLEGRFSPLQARNVVIGSELLGRWQFHNFWGGRPTIPITLRGGGFDEFVMQWDEPFASVSVNRKGADADLDLFLFADAAATQPIFISASNNINGDAIEGIAGISLDSEDPNVAVTVYLAVGKRDDPSAGRPQNFKIMSFDLGTPTGLPVEQFNKSTIYGHANSPWAISACAVRYDQINRPGGPLIEPFSSLGGQPITLDQYGRRLARPFDTRKPDLCGVDGGNTTFFFPGDDYENDGFPNFFGTSAASPHVAGVVALMQDAADGQLPFGVAAPLLRFFAKDMDDPTTSAFDQGYDRRTGDGFVRSFNPIRYARLFGRRPSWE
jgi:Subtilase family